MSGRRIPRVAVCVAMALASAAALSACGSSDQLDAGEVARIKADARREALADARSRDAVRETRQLRRELDRLRNGGDGSSAGHASSGGSSSTGSTTCDPGLSVNSVTSCPFARNVRSTYESSGGASSIDVYSPVTGQTYRMSCTGGVPVVCSGGNDAVVYIR
jgi:hypothetical protein